MSYQIKVTGFVQDYGDGSFGVHIFPTREAAEAEWAERNDRPYPTNEKELNVINAYDNGILQDETISIEVENGVPRITGNFSFSSE